MPSKAPKRTDYYELLEEVHAECLRRDVTFREAAFQAYGAWLKSSAPDEIDLPSPASPAIVLGRLGKPMEHKPRADRNKITPEIDMGRKQTVHIGAGRAKVLRVEFDRDKETAFAFARRKASEMGCTPAAVYAVLRNRCYRDPEYTPPAPGRAA